MSSNIKVSLKCNGQTYEHLQISIISLNRNYGQYKVINFGLKKIKTEYTIILSCDLQDDVRLINKMINASKQNDLIVSERHIRNDGLLNKFFGRLYWGMIKKISINEHLNRV